MPKHLAWGWAAVAAGPGSLSVQPSSGLWAVPSSHGGTARPQQRQQPGQHKASPQQIQRRASHRHQREAKEQWVTDFDLILSDWGGEGCRRHWRSCWISSIVARPRCPSCVGNGIHSAPADSTSPVISSPPRRQHSISYPHHGKTRKGSRASSIGYTAFSPRPSLSRHSSIATNPPLDRTKVKDYLLLSVLACFCPVWPINIVGFVYSIMVRWGLIWLYPTVNVRIRS